MVADFLGRCGESTRGLVWNTSKLRYTCGQAKRSPNYALSQSQTWQQDARNDAIALRQHALLIVFRVLGFCYMFFLARERDQRHRMLCAEMVKFAFQATIHSEVESITPEAQCLGTCCPSLSAEKRDSLLNEEISQVRILALLRQKIECRGTANFSNGTSQRPQGPPFMCNAPCDPQLNTSPSRCRACRRRC